MKDSYMKDLQGVFAGQDTAAGDIFRSEEEWQHRVRVVGRSISPRWGSTRLRLALCTYDAPPWGCIVRVVPGRLTNEIKNNTHPANITALVREQARSATMSEYTKMENAYDIDSNRPVRKRGTTQRGPWGTLSTLSTLSTLCQHCQHCQHRVNTVNTVNTVSTSVNTVNTVFELVRRILICAYAPRVCVASYVHVRMRRRNRIGRRSHNKLLPAPFPRHAGTVRIVSVDALGQ